MVIKGELYEKMANRHIVKSAALSKNKDCEVKSIFENH